MGHRGNQLCPKYNGFIGPKVYNNKGVAQGIAISDMLFTVYLDKLMVRYGGNIHEKFEINRPRIIARSEQAEYAWAPQQQIARYREKGGIELKTPTLKGHCAREYENDTHIFSDDMAIKTSGTKDICH